MTYTTRFKYLLCPMLVLFFGSQLWVNVFSYVCHATDQIELLIELTNTEEKESEQENDKKEKNEHLVKHALHLMNQESEQLLDTQLLVENDLSHYLEIITPPPESMV